MSKQDVYQDVTDRIVDALEQGVVPWRKPWTSSSQLPINVRSGKPYRGINVFLLALGGMKAGYSDPRWGTFKAMKEAGGSVRKGEKGTKIILWKPVRGQHENDAGEQVGHQYLLLREYTVFNVQQCDGIEPLELDESVRVHTPDQAAEAIVAGYKLRPWIGHGSSQACYAPETDSVHMPNPERFESSDAYYTTLFHELVHSTGHESRLNRLEPALFGSDPYAKEELVAELGAAMLAGLAGLGEAGGEQSAAYIGGWLRKLRDDRKLVVQAAAAAQRAADRIVGETFELEAGGEAAGELEPALAAA